MFHSCHVTGFIRFCAVGFMSHEYNICSIKWKESLNIEPHSRQSKTFLFTRNTFSRITFTFILSVMSLIVGGVC